MTKIESGPVQRQISLRSQSLSHRFVVSSNGSGQLLPLAALTRPALLLLCLHAGHCSCAGLQVGLAERYDCFGSISAAVASLRVADRAAAVGGVGEVLLLFVVLTVCERQAALAVRAQLTTNSLRNSMGVVIPGRGGMTVANWYY
jgi:hypothetical protein